MDLANWMGALPSVLFSLPLTWLAIPGSHDSFSYSLTPDSEIAPDEPRLQCFDHCLCFSPFIKRFIYKWTVTQSLTCKQQLHQGIRYFDFRLAARLGTLVPYIVHGMYGCSVVTVLEEIDSFLKEHHTEIVLLDFQHFYNFTSDMHSYLIGKVREIFGKKLCPFIKGPVNLSTLWQNKYQILIFYRDYHGEAIDDLWPSSYMPNPWPNAISVSELIHTLEYNYREKRKPDHFYVTQGILSPDLSYVLFHFYTTLQHDMAPKAQRALLNWVKLKKAGENGLNVVMTDFVNMPPYNFSSAIISLNEKLSKSLIAKGSAYQ